MISARVRPTRRALFALLDLDYPNIERGVTAFGCSQTRARDPGRMLGRAMVTTLGHGALASSMRANDRRRRSRTSTWTTSPTNRRSSSRAAFDRGGRAGEMARVRFARAARRPTRPPFDWCGLTRRPRRARSLAGDLPRTGVSRLDDATLALTGARTRSRSRTRLISRRHLHIAPSPGALIPPVSRTARAGREAEKAGPGRSPVLCEPISGAALPAYSPPRILARTGERRKKQGFWSASTRVGHRDGPSGQLVRLPAAAHRPTS